MDEKIPQRDPLRAFNKHVVQVIYELQQFFPNVPMDFTVIGSPVSKSPHGFMVSTLSHEEVIEEVLRQKKNGEEGREIKTAVIRGD